MEGLDLFGGRRLLRAQHALKTSSTRSSFSQPLVTSIHEAPRGADAEPAARGAEQHVLEPRRAPAQQGRHVVADLGERDPVGLEPGDWAKRRPHAVQRHAQVEVGLRLVSAARRSARRSR